MSVRRKDALTKPCPKCGAEAGEPCWGMRKPRQPRRSPHIQRYKPEEAARRKKHGDRKTTWLYIIGPSGTGGPVKIGISRNTTGRLTALQVAAHDELVIHAKYPLDTRAIAIKTEKIFHRENSNKRLRGEWFNLTPQEASRLVEIMLMREGGNDQPNS